MIRAQRSTPKFISISLRFKLLCMFTIETIHSFGKLAGNSSNIPIISEFLFVKIYIYILFVQ